MCGEGSPSSSRAIAAPELFEIPQRFDGTVDGSAVDQNDSPVDFDLLNLPTNLREVSRSL